MNLEIFKKKEKGKFFYLEFYKLKNSIQSFGCRIEKCAEKIGNKTYA